MDNFRACRRRTAWSSYRHRRRAPPCPFDLHAGILGSNSLMTAAHQSPTPRSSFCQDTNSGLALGERRQAGCRQGHRRCRAEDDRFPETPHDVFLPNCGLCPSLFKSAQGFRRGRTPRPGPDGSWYSPRLAGDLASKVTAVLARQSNAGIRARHRWRSGTRMQAGCEENADANRCIGIISAWCTCASVAMRMNSVTPLWPISGCRIAQARRASRA